MEFSFIDHILAFIILVIFPVLSANNGKPNKELIESLPPKKHLYYTNGLLLIIAALLILTAWNIENRSWILLGVRMPEINQIVILAVATIAVIYLVDIVSTFFKKDKTDKKLEDLTYVIPLNWSEFKHYIFLACAAGFSEEIVYRGFLIHYILYIGHDLPYSEVYAIAIPAIAFAISHRYQGWWAVSKISLIAILLGIVYYYSASLLIVIIIHILIDIISGIMGVLYFKKHRLASQSEETEQEL